MLQLGIDVGGTFTDFVMLQDGHAPVVTKVHSNHENPTDVMLDGIRKLKINIPDIESVYYGATIGVNALIQGKGATCLLLTTKGFRDVYAIGRLSKKEMYNPFEQKHPLLVGRDRTIEVTERVLQDGTIEVPLDENEVRKAVEGVLADCDADSVAIAFINSYANPAHEQQAARVIRKAFPDLHVTQSCSLTREWYEFERTCTAVLNAYVTPIVAKHIRGMLDVLSANGFRGGFFVMQSNGSVCRAERVFDRAISTLNSGTSAGAIGGSRLARSFEEENVITVDMGGTSFDVAVSDRGQLRMSANTVILKHPTLVQSVDVYSIGAGGGSIAWIDAGGALQVGPMSAEANPGPVFYGKGGSRPTVADADLITGRLNPAYLLGGEMVADAVLAGEVMKREIGDRFGWTAAESSIGVINIIDNKMAYAIRSMTVERGLDPGEFSLVAFGGAGGLHASAIARALGIPRVIVPPVPANFSALGMLSSDIRHDLSRTVLLPLEDGKAVDDIIAVEHELLEESRQVLDEEGVRGPEMEFRSSLDCRYVGQEYSLSIEHVAGVGEKSLVACVRDAFDKKHQAEYGFSLPNADLEVSSVKTATIGRRPSVQPPTAGKRRSTLAQARKGVRSVYLAADRPTQVSIFEREEIPFDAEIAGPAVIEEPLSTILLLPGDRARVAADGCLIIEEGDRS